MIFHRCIIFFDIVFQSGEFYNDNPSSWIVDLLIAIVGAAIGAGGAIWAVNHSFRKDKTKEEEKRIQFQIEKVKYFKSLVETIIKKLLVQIQNNNQFTKHLLENQLSYPQLELETFYELDRIVHRLNQEDYYHAYLGQFGDSNESIEEFRKLYAILDFFEANITQIKLRVKTETEADSSRKTELEKLATSAMDKSSLLLRNQSISNQKKILEFVSKVLSEYHDGKTESTGYEYLQKNFVDRMKEGLIKYENQLDQVDLIVLDLKDCTIKYWEIIENAKLFANEMEEVTTVLSSTLDKFSKVSQRLVNYSK